MTQFADVPAELKRDLEARPVSAAKGWRELIGTYLPNDFARHLPEDGDALIWEPKQLLEHDNAFVAVLEACDRSSLAIKRPMSMDPLLQVMTLTFFLCDLPGNGDCMMAHLPRDSDTAHVTIWDHEGGFFGAPVAADIASAKRVVAVGKSKRTTAERTNGVSPALGRVDLNVWPFSTIISRLVDEDVCTYDAAMGFEPPASKLTDYQRRAWWICNALTGGRIELELLREQADWEPSAALAGNYLSSYAPTALYWLWRGFLLEEPWLDDVLARTRNSESRLIADAAKLIDSLIAAPDSIVAGVDFAAVKAVVRERLAEAFNPFPEQVKSGIVTFDRVQSPPAELVDAAAAAAAAEANNMTAGPAVPPAAPAGTGNPLESSWDVQDCYLGRSSTPGRLVVKGQRRAANAGDAPLQCVFEIDENGQVTMVVDFDGAIWGTFVDEDTFVVADSHAIYVGERRGTGGVLCASAAASQSRSFWSSDRRTLIVSGGIYNVELNAAEPLSLSVLRIDGRQLRYCAQAELALPVVREHRGVVYAGDPGSAIWYRISGLPRIVEDDAPEPILRPSHAFVPESLTPVGAALPSDAWDSLVTTDGAVLQIVANELVIQRPSADPDSAPETSSVVVGADAELLGMIADRRVAVLAARESPLVLLSISPKVRLLGALDPYDGDELSIEIYENPTGVQRLGATMGELQLSIHGLEFALTDLDDYSAVGKMLQSRPWKSRQLVIDA